MKVAIFSTKAYDRRYLEAANIKFNHDLTFLEPRLTQETVSLGAGFQSVCVFVNDYLDKRVLRSLADGGTSLIALRCAGFNNVDLYEATQLGMTVVRVPAYSPHAVAEHTVGLMLTLSRKFHRAYARVREGNFALDGLLGFDFFGKTVGVVGTGQIGLIVAQIMKGFGCKVVAHDPFPKRDVQAIDEYLPLPELFTTSDIVTLHCPLTPETYHLIGDNALSQMKTGVMLINTGRGALIDTRAVIDALKAGKIGYLGLDVYEEESYLFFEDLSNKVIQDDLFTRLLTFPNVVITGHQGFFTDEALRNIADTTLANISAYEQGTGEMHIVSTDHLLNQNI
jgi:D-lactate dehydrogenase